jgi:hypothetical protein
VDTLQDKKNHKPSVVHFFIDKQNFETSEKTLSVRTLLVDFAKEDPTQTVLVLKHGQELTRFTNLDEQVELKNGTHFVVFHEGPTTVS